MLKNYKYTFGGFLFALFITLTSRTSYFFHTGKFPLRLLPPDPHDRIMFLVVSAMLIFLGFCADRNTRLLIAHEKEKRKVFSSAVAASQHILNNFLNNILYFQMQARDSGALDEKTLELLDTVIHDAASQLKKLGEISEISEESIRETIYPK